MKKKLSDSSYCFIGDIHGCLHELNELLDAFVVPRLISKGCPVVFLGDYLDRGPHSVATLRRVRDFQNQYPKKVVCLLGNHEDYYLRYHRHHQLERSGGPANPMRAEKEQLNIFEELSDEDFQWMKSMPIYWQEAGLLAVHGGPPKGWRPSNTVGHYPQQILRLRFVSPQGYFVSYGHETELDKHWSESYQGDLGVVVYGHSSWPAIHKSYRAWGLDTGCCYGGQLSAILINSEGELLEEYGVRARLPKI